MKHVRIKYKIGTQTVLPKQISSFLSQFPDQENGGIIVITTLYSSQDYFESGSHIVNLAMYFKL